MKVLVTGASGFVGSGILRSLRWHGHSAVGLVRDKEKGRALARLGLEAAIGDMQRPETYEPLVGQVDAVIHAAQTPLVGRWSRRRIAHMHQTDALMTRSLAWACLEQSKPLIYTSGALTHCGDGPAWINESSPARPALIAQGHAAMVEWLTAMHQQHGLKSIVLSPGLVYGAGGFLRTTVELLLKRRYLHCGDPANFWSLVHVDDLGEAYVTALERGKFGESYFIADDQPLRRGEVIDRVANALGLPRVGRAPEWLIRLAFGQAMVEAATASVRLRNKKARRELGWEPRYSSSLMALGGVLRELGEELSYPPAARTCERRAGAWSDWFFPCLRKHS